MSKEAMKAFGSRLCAERMRAGLTQAELGAKSNTNPFSISNWEIGYSYPQIRPLMRVCRALGCSCDELLGLKPIQYTAEQRRLLERIAQLDEAGIYTVEAVIDSQLRRLSGDD